MVRYWLFKSEPSAFSFQDLLDAPRKRTLWEGIRNYQARNYLRDEVAVGDGVLFYHSSSEPPCAVGIARVTAAALPDTTAPRERGKGAETVWFAVEIEARRALPRSVPLAEMKANPALAKMLLVQRGQRLSIQPLTESEWRTVLGMGRIADRK